MNLAKQWKFLCRTYRTQATKAIHFRYLGKWLYKNLALNKQKGRKSEWFQSFSLTSPLFYSLQNYKNIYSDYILYFLKLLPENVANTKLVLGRKFSSIILQSRHLQSINFNSDNVLIQLDLCMKKMFQPKSGQTKLIIT